MFYAPSVFPVTLVQRASGSQSGLVQWTVYLLSALPRFSTRTRTLNTDSISVKIYISRSTTKFGSMECTRVRRDSDRSDWRDATILPRRQYFSELETLLDSPRRTYHASRSARQCTVRGAGLWDGWPRVSVPCGHATPRLVHLCCVRYTLYALHPPLYTSSLYTCPFHFLLAMPLDTLPVCSVVIPILHNSNAFDSQRKQGSSADCFRFVVTRHDFTGVTRVRMRSHTPVSRFFFTRVVSP